MDTHDRILAILAERGISKRKLAKMADIPASTLISALSSKEKRLSMYMVLKIASALEVPLEDLMGDQFVQDLKKSTAQLHEGIERYKEKCNETLVVLILMAVDRSQPLVEQAEPLISEIIANEEMERKLDTAIRLKNTLIHNDEATAISILKKEVEQIKQEGDNNADEKDDPQG